MPTQKTEREAESSEDVQLVNAARQGDMAAFEELVNRHTGVVFRVAMHIMNSRDDAEDIVQETFLKAFQYLPAFEGRSRFSTWLSKIAVNSALTKYRSARRATTISIDQEAEEGGSLVDKVADWKPNPEQLYKRAELREILQRALASLPHSYRVVFLLRDVEGMPATDTAEMLGLSVPNVKARLFRARLKLREYLSQYFERGNSRESSLPVKKMAGELRALAVAL